MSGGPVTVAVGRILRVVSFVGFYLVWFLRANLVVATEIVTPGNTISPAIVEVRLRSRTRFEISAFMSLVSLTPGTLAIALSDDRERLAVHGMHADDVDGFVRGLRTLEDRMLAAWRPPGWDDGSPADDATTARW